MANYATMGAMRDTMDDDPDDKDDTKRKSRNLSEKKRRDQFNMLVNELGSMVSTNTRKMDKSTVLKSTILFLKNHNEIAVRSRVHEIQEDWKPSFLSNEEFTHLILEALDGFIMIFSSNGRIYYASESVTSLLGYLPSELASSTIYEITYQDDQSLLYNVLLNPVQQDDRLNPGKNENQVSFTCHIKRGSLDSREEPIYERVHFVGYFRSDSDLETLIPSSRYSTTPGNDTKQVFVGTGRLHTPQLIRNVSLIDVNKSEFVSKHSLEWKFLFLDQRASPIIGYLPFEVLGTSGYDYYHVDDLDEVVTCHESLMRKGEGTSCFYRFLTKGQQWIWLQTRFYIDYNQWNSKPEFIVCTHNVVNYSEVLKQKKKTDAAGRLEQSTPPTPPSNWSPKSMKHSIARGVYHKTESDTSISVGSQSSRMSTSTAQSAKIKTKPVEEPQCVSYNQPSYSEPILVPSAGFLKPTAPGVAVSVAPAMIVNQQNLVMTPVQNQIQDELQRKHEELQQLIVHQQEELRRVSEQLLIARYGILSPLMNVGVPYARCDVPQDGNLQSVPGSGVQQVTVPVSVPVPVPVPVSIVPVESFAHSTVIPVAPVVSTTGGTGGIFMQPRMAPPHVHRDAHMQQGQMQDPSQMPFQICQLPEVLYNNGSGGQQRPS